MAYCIDAVSLATSSIHCFNWHSLLWYLSTPACYFTVCIFQLQGTIVALGSCLWHKKFHRSCDAKESGIESRLLAKSRSFELEPDNLSKPVLNPFISGICHTKLFVFRDAEIFVVLLHAVKGCWWYFSLLQLVSTLEFLSCKQLRIVYTVFCHLNTYHIYAFLNILPIVLVFMDGLIAL